MSEIRMNEDGTAYLEIPWTLRRNGRYVKIVVPEASEAEIRSEPLAQAVIKAYKYARLIESGKYDTVLQLAQSMNRDRSAVARTLSLVNLSPEVVSAIFSGTMPAGLTLNKVLYGFPDDWQEQKRFFGLESQFQKSAAE